MSYIPPTLRQLVFERAGGCCEYCRVPLKDRGVATHIDHIISVKHEGSTSESNLCLACFNCNSYKGTDIAAIDSVSESVTTLYNPRIDVWDDHFTLDGFVIEPQTPKGRVTVKLLNMNAIDMRILREALLDVGMYPCVAPAVL